MRKLATFICTLLAAMPLIAQDVSYPELFGKDSTQKFPYSMTGQLIFTSGRSDFQGTGTTIYGRSVLTAAHNLWDAQTGWSTNVEFNRARYGRKIDSQVFARRLFVYGGYAAPTIRYGADSSRAFANDLGGLRFSSAPANGSFAGWSPDNTPLTGDAYNIALGYGADTHSGDELLFVTPSLNFYQTRGAFFENDSLTFEGGMSGGPVFAEVEPGEFRVVAVIVAGSDDPPSGGVRAINDGGARFIRTYLQY